MVLWPSLVVQVLSVQYSLTGQSDAVMAGSVREDMAFEAREECFHGCVTTCRANALAISLNLPASFAVSLPSAVLVG